MSKANMSLADKVENYSYMQPFTPEEMEQKRVELADKAIKLRGFEKELDEIKDSFKKKMKPIQKEVDSLLTNLHQKAEAREEDCFVFFEQGIGMAIYYNQDGVEVGRRPLYPAERNTTIFNELRKEGTND